MKTIGLFDVDSVLPNLALMKVSNYYKEKGFKTEFYSPLFHDNYHKIFASKVFNYPHPNDNYLKSDMIRGGQGFDFLTKLPEKIDHMYPDYSLYGIDYAMGYLTKGCVRRCKFCIVPKMEGNIHKHASLEEFCNDQKKVLLLDNNILSYENHLDELKNLLNSGKRIDFNQGLDIRKINEKNAKLLKEIPRWRGIRYRFAFDSPVIKKIIQDKLKVLSNAGITNGTIQFYILIGFNTTHPEDLMRVKFLQKRGIAIFAMPYNKLDPYQMRFARWVNRYFYKYQSWEKYNEGIVQSQNSRSTSFLTKKITSF